ncbi:MAG: hypothetical protein K8F34_05995 [Candidatus Kuenenia stuttgartiensis]|nr:MULTISPECIES: hypothetical protein [Kuenenia]MBZ0191224.1 hypothetical protein [Candidatus Kuenenia stuttgartiensis]MCL4727988.1 hypothetical protein [Candidatus Kuenenia stuttgartiensis]MCZ7623282.1 hypothetical protein [Candidatus Kuenenia sp.]SOH06553.1 hypothetical protein KSMBR1_4081 [Candidatus Kuenenia stuttgartiensis]
MMLHVTLFCFSVMPAYALEDNGIKDLRQTGKAFASVAREVSPSVVFIQHYFVKNH